MKYSISIAALVATLAGATTWAGPTAEQAKQLGTSLTPWGAQKAGNKDGSIPEYTGGITQPPAGFTVGSGKWIDPYAADKVVVSIDAKNMAQYADKLTPGTQELLKRWAGSYRVDVYPTRRSYPAMSKEHAEGTLKNAANPECKTVADGVGIRGCWEGIPFPLPGNGYEAMWNHALAEKPPAIRGLAISYLIDSAGNRAAPLETLTSMEFPYWDDKETPYSGIGLYYRRASTETVTPVRDAGSKVLFWYPLQMDSEDQRTWSYSTGQRRTRLTPEYAYDTPVAALGGSMYFDEINSFAGRMDMFNFKLVGKREMYVPYNSYKVNWTPAETVLGKQHVNPDVMRWELHRVWVVEATLKDGKRHVASKRNYYIDEDSWTILASEGFDQSGKIFRVILSHTEANYAGGGGLLDRTSASQVYDLAKGSYGVQSQYGAPSAYYKIVERTPQSSAKLGPDAMAAAGVR